MKKPFRQTTLGLYFGYMRIHMRQQLQYKGWIFMLLPSLVYVVTDPLDALLMLGRFGSLGEWTAARILLIYGMAVLCYGLSELLGRGFVMFPYYIRDGAFDRVLLRPRSTFLQALTLTFTITRLNRVAGGALLVIVTLALQGVRLTLFKALVLLGGVVGGIMTYVGIFVIQSVISLFTIAPIELKIFTNGSYQVAKVPPHALPDWLRHSFTFLFPMFMFTYYPAAGTNRPGSAAWRCRSAARSLPQRCFCGVWASGTTKAPAPKPLLKQKPLCQAAQGLQRGFLLIMAVSPRPAHRWPRQRA